MSASENAAPVQSGPVVVIGGGPAGLTAGYELTRLGQPAVVLEKSGAVGGLARTESYKGFRFDLGGHRFYTKASAVMTVWRDVLGDDMLVRPRMSRIYYKRRFFDYPLRPLNALAGLGFLEGVRIVLSYLVARLFPYRVEETFEQWVTNRFGRRLFETFFKAYTEKVWGISCSELKAEWAAQRIKDLSLRTAILNMIVRPRHAIRSLIEEFHYPRFGPGMMWEAVQQRIDATGGTVRLHSDVIRIEREGRRISAIVVGADGTEETIPAAACISSMPITELVAKLEPPPEPGVRAAAAALRYRDFLTVCVIVRADDLFPDNWIYIQDPDVTVGRIQNFKNWSPEMVPDPTRTSLGLEYFCNEGDALWSLPDAELVALAKRELETIGLVRGDAVEDGCVLRVPKAYPIYDSAHTEALATVRAFVDGFENLQTIGRNGLHRYNNQDHAMLTGLFAARNLVRGEQNDLWSVNADEEYLEEAVEAVEATDHDVAAEVSAALSWIGAKIDRLALGTAFGVVAGAALCLATLWLVLKGGGSVGQNLSLLGQYFPGFEVSALGSLIALGYGFATGFALGWSVALVRNASVFLWIALVRRRVEEDLLKQFFDYV